MSTGSPRRILSENRFKKDLKRIGKQGKDLDRLEAVVNVLRDRERLPPERCDHALKGGWKGYRECHIQPDWLLIYALDEETVRLARTGSHAELFES